MTQGYADSRAEQPLRTIHEIKPGSFIFEQPGSLPAGFCAEVIQHFEKTKEEQYEGRIGQLAGKNSSIKKSTDLVVSGKANWKDVDQTFFRALGLAIREFRESYPFFKGPFKDMGYGIQRTRASEYYHWHVDGGSHDFSHRQLVAIWYLNDVAGPGGETEFLFRE